MKPEILHTQESYTIPSMSLVLEQDTQDRMWFAPFLPKVLKRTRIIHY